MKRYITLNQVNVKIAGGTDKLLVIRDVTSIVMNENIMHIKRQMSKMTETMVEGVQKRAIHAEQKLAKLDQFISNQEGQALNDDAFIELKRMQYQIRDFQQVFAISENKFKGVIEQLNIRQALQEIAELVKPDCKNRNIELGTNVE